MIDQARLRVGWQLGRGKRVGIEFSGTGLAGAKWGAHRPLLERPSAHPDARCEMVGGLHVVSRITPQVCTSDVRSRMGRDGDGDERSQSVDSAITHIRYFVLGVMFSFNFCK